MNSNKLVYKTKPKNFSLFGILFLILIGIYFVYTSESLLIKMFIGGIFLFTLILGMIRIYLANGMLISEDKIEIIKRNLKGKTESEFIDFREIIGINYNHGKYRQDRAIYIKRKLKPGVKVLIPNNSFEFGYVLKFLNEKGIEINLVHSDHELRMYIDGEISEFPMSNENGLE